MSFWQTFTIAGSFLFWAFASISLEMYMRRKGAEIDARLGRLEDAVEGPAGPLFGYGAGEDE